MTQVKLIKMRYLVFRYAYIIKNGNEERITPYINKDGEWIKIDLFGDCLLNFIGLCASNSDIKIYIKEKVIDIFTCKVVHNGRNLHD